MRHGSQVLEQEAQIFVFDVVGGGLAPLGQSLDGGKHSSASQLVRLLGIHLIELLNFNELAQGQNDPPLRFQVDHENGLPHLHVDFDILLQHVSVLLVLGHRLLHLYLCLHLMILELNVLWIILKLLVRHVVQHPLLIPEEYFLK